jgi:nuclear pore complex protein Nup85
MVNHTLYVGPEKFASCVANIAPSLQKLQTQPGPQWIFIHRLIFAVRYAEFHTYKANGNLSDAAWDLVEILHDDIAPKSWWGVILCDTVELLTRRFSRGYYL